MSLRSLLLALVALGISHASADTKPIKLGVVFGLTGAADRWSKYQMYGVQLAVEDLKKEGVEVTLVTDDSHSEPARAITSFNKFISVDKVDGVVGDIFSFVTQPLIPLATQRKRVLVSPSTPEALSMCDSNHGYFFTTASQIPMAIEGYGRFLTLHPEIKKVALIYFQDPGWGFQYRDMWRRLAAERGVTITGEYESPDLLPDFKTPILKLMKDKPDAFFVAHEPRSFMAAVHQLHFPGAVVFANNVLEIPAGKDTSTDLNGVFFVDTLAPEEFQKRFHDRFGVPVLLEPYNGYEAIRVLARALAANPTAPNQAIRSLKYEGITGPIDFTTSCAGNRSQWHLKRFRGDRIEVIGEIVKPST